jgi:hypothetical protein
MKLLAQIGRKCRRSSADAADLAARIEIVRALHDDVLRRHLRGEEHFERQHRGVLGVRRPENHPLGTGVIANLAFFFEDRAAFVLPPSGSVVDIVQRGALQHQSECQLNLLYADGRTRAAVIPGGWDHRL